MKSDGLLIEVIDAVAPEDILSINNPDQLATVDSVLRGRMSMGSNQEGMNT